MDKGGGHLYTFTQPKLFCGYKPYLFTYFGEMLMVACISLYYWGNVAAEDARFGGSCFFLSVSDHFESICKKFFFSLKTDIHDNLCK